MIMRPLCLASLLCLLAQGAQALVVFEDEVAGCIGFLKAEEAAMVFASAPSGHTPADMAHWQKILREVRAQSANAPMDDAAFGEETAKVFSEALPIAIASHTGATVVIDPDVGPEDPSDYMTSFAKECWMISEEFAAP